MRILFVSSEIAPFAKSGGLADVAGSLPKALAGLGLDMTLVMPLYGNIDRQKHGITDTGARVWSPALGREFELEVWTAKHDGCTVYFLRSADLFDRPDLYGPPGGEYGDNLLRFVVFNRGVIELARWLDLRPDVVHVHDWQCALLPAFIKTRPFDIAPMASSASVITVHNLAYQGVYGRELFGETQLPPFMDTIQGAEYWGNISILKAGLVCADAITTVSPTYAWEIQTPEGGHSMDGVLASRRSVLRGILNGADYDLWSPESDPYLPQKFSADDMTGKVNCRDELLNRFGLEPADDGCAVISFLGRLTHQKGVDFIIETVPKIMLDNVRLCLFGSGDSHLENTLRDLAARYPGRLGAIIGFNEELAHILTSGSDILLMPSRYEPCGLSQLYAMRAGTIPVVRATGGLADTVPHFDPMGGQGTGFTFDRPDGRSLHCALREALWTFQRPELWRRLQHNAMSKDYSWDASARQYMALYHEIAS